MVELTTDAVWRVLAKQNFMVIGMISARGQARTVGVMPLVLERTLWFTTNTQEWHAKHLAANPEVSVTVAIPKRVPFVPWIKIPAATITFSGVAEILPAAQMPREAREKLVRGLELGGDERGALIGVGVRPTSDFVTYGVGVSVLGMRDTEKARGRAPSG
ncbi:pyridoxamine 5'-phosphate oxidase-related protein FMN-binding [Beutenbergia cavernae DSM 12333]|uniref:Pyridoxamine 5'-phosphate oxidase-related protein FMN-binding n=1 Tax=Beutenbergia cavernae (strain ATCC BAA-8 / DSM 12333 / CCUG 43141 / JCM 11478 / NBRC 16432 / NCIMB 13614 / HKI 0122) TaxID=471853 RepID=C5BVL1_BEUC1|nr:pyridoxamine 5'-phosphate oxidase family protein [Beutenbergia cavernae]ACQ78451.1 pyridoxamine 5'-phosphate oxidase-related protein FMN-binding [Beutenbergia cavernae DSM 12333]